METMFLGLGLVLLTANCIILIVLLVGRDSNRSGHHINGEPEGRAAKPRGQLFRDELGRSRVESAGSAREHRQEIVTSFQSLSDIVVAVEMVEFGQSQGAKLDSFSGQLRDTALEMGRKLDSSREAVDEVLRSVAVHRGIFTRSFVRRSQMRLPH